MRKGNLEKFIAKATEIHKGKYDYTWLREHEPNSAKEKVKIWCPVHGYFESCLSNHIHLKRGCPKCAGVVRKTQEQFLEEAKEACKDRNYSFEKVVYENMHTPIIVTCHEKDAFENEHGDFEILPKSLIRGNVCPKCSRNYKLSTDEWIAMAEKVHGKGRYDYSEMGEYTGNPKDKAIFICHEKDEFGNEHGPFLQQFCRHLEGRGCQKCGGSKKMTKEDFVRKARKIHGDKYGYEHFDYVNTTTKSWITCPVHGDFLQAPKKHLVGQGCKHCNDSILEERLEVMFDKNNVYYEREVNLEGLGTQTIDFYLPQKHLYIECQGKQHYKPSRFSNSKSNEEAEKDYQHRILYDKQKYDAVTAIGYTIMYYTDPTLYSNRNIDVFGGWYEDKKVFVVKEELLDYVQSLPDFQYEPKEEYIRRYRRFEELVKWDFEKCKEEAKRFKNRREFSLGNPAAYLSAKNNGWLDDVMPRGCKPPGYWTKEKIFETALLYKSPKDFCENYPTAYRFASKYHILKELVYKEERNLHTSRSNIEEFKEKFFKKFPDSNLSFEKSEYVKSSVPMLVTCPIHGDFWRTPNKLLCGRLCSKCLQEAKIKNINHG